ncbi:MAG TPA: zinc ribbon domain-containing protein [Kofleriaceae bacterium]
MLLFGIIAVVVVSLIGVGLTAVESRKEEVLVFRCTKCGAEFEQRSHRDYPRACAKCGARDWATS